MATFNVHFDTTSFDTDSITVEADTEDEAVAIAYGEMQWRYDEIEIANVEEIDGTV